MHHIFDFHVFHTDVYHIVHWFLIYSIIGWFVESVYMSFCNRKIINRGFIKGPICPIYGIGALTVFFILYPLRFNFVALFFLGSLLATFLEWATAIIMQQLFGNVWWDYRDKPYNYKGILCLESSIAWGFYTVFLFAFLHRFVSFFVESYTEWMGVAMGRFLGSVLIFYYIFAFAVTVLREKPFKKRPVERFNKMLEFIRK